LLELHRIYPFSAVIKILNAKIASIEQSPELNKYITSAAITTVDRSNFQHYIRSEEWEISSLPANRINVPEPDTSITPETELETEPEVREKEEDTPLGKTESEDQATAEKEISSHNEELTGEKKKPEEEGLEVSDTDTIAVDTEPEEKDSPLKKSPDKKKVAVDKKKDEELVAEDEQTPDQPEEIKEEITEKAVSEQEVSEKQEEIKGESLEEVSGEVDEQPSSDEIPPASDEKMSEEPIISPSESAQMGNEKYAGTEESHGSASGETQDEEEPGPLASDLLKNIQEYRKNREFFEKILGDDKEEDAGEGPKTEKLPSEKGDTANKLVKSHKHKKDKKKKPVSEKGIKGDLSEEKITETDADQVVKKNFANKNRKTPEEVEEIRGSTGGPETKPSSAKDAQEAGSAKEKVDVENKGREEEISLTSGEKQEIPAEIPDEETIEKVTEDQKSEGYEVDEEEDPAVIKDFLEKISAGSEEYPSPKKLKKEEQVEIIERFIQSEPKIKNIKTAQALREREDLSAPSVKFKDDIVSENLANIMKNQGKTEQAIDIYKKLIWKFPQKKTYFASQIDELKKKLGK